MDDAKWMRHCIQLASQAKGLTSPNPMVGAVLVRDDKILTEAFHQRAGELHAERLALKDYTGDVKDATLYVNLEPCCHYGRTPPCTDIILEKKISRVVVAMEDPYEKVRGKGIQILIDAGVDVVVGIEREAAVELNRFFMTSVHLNRPWITLKTAVSLDGRIASAYDESKWITNADSRHAGHLLRGEHDAIMVGIGTVLADNPRLNVRVNDSVGNRDPLPVILDSRLRCPTDASVLTAGKRPLVYYDAAIKAQWDLNADIVPVRRQEKGLDLFEIMTDLNARQVRSLLVEGGSSVHGELMRNDLVDAIEMFISPKVLGGGRNWLAGLNYHLSECPQFKLHHMSLNGNDIHLSLRRDNHV